MPFKSDFFTDGQPVPADFSACGDRPFPPYATVIQEGFGEATHIGRFSVIGSFCGNVTDLLDDGMLTGSESIPYDSGVFTLTAADGDQLWIEISGAVLPSDDPDFDFEFFDEFQFVGGTGRFEGAAGSGVTNSFVDSASDRTQHEWDGELTLVRP